MTYKIDPNPPCGTPTAFLPRRMSRMGTKQGRERVRNRHPGYCNACQRWVPAGEGTPSYSERTKKWVVYC